MIKIKKSSTESILVILLYILTFICLLVGTLGYTTIAMLMFAIILISGSIFGFAKNAITFLPIRTTSSFANNNDYKDKGILMSLLGYLINGLTLLFGLYLAYFIIFGSKIN